MPLLPDSLSRTPSSRAFHPFVILGICAVALVAVGLFQPLDGGEGGPQSKAIEATHGMVVSVSPPASKVGCEILQKGGNAVDAAVATAFALAVTYPSAGNIGGGGFMLVYPGHGQEPVVFEYRETAPSAASRTM